MISATIIILAAAWLILSEIIYYFIVTTNCAPLEDVDFIGLKMASLMISACFTAGVYVIFKEELYIYMLMGLAGALVIVLFFYLNILIGRKCNKKQKQKQSKSNKAKQTKQTKQTKQK